MIKEFPQYKGKSTNDLLNTLSKENQKIIREFLEYCGITAGQSSLKKIKLKVVQIGYVFNKNLNNLTLQDLRDFLLKLNKSSFSTDTSNDLKKVLKRFLKWKYEDYSKKFKGLEDIKQKRKASSEKLQKKDLLTSEDIEKMMRLSKNMKYKTMIILFSETGARPEELYNLKWKDVNIPDKEVYLKSAKTGDARTVVINNSANRLHIYKQEYPYPDVQAEDYVFPSNTNRKKPMNYQTFINYLTRLGEKIGKHLNPYLFRHTRLNEIRKKLSPDVYQKFAGHSMEVALEHYSHIDSEDVKQEMFERIYNIEELTKSEREDFNKLKEEVKEIKKKIPFNYKEQYKEIMKVAEEMKKMASELKLLEERYHNNSKKQK